MPAPIRFRMKGADLYDRLGNRLGRLSGNTVIDALNRRLGYVDGEGIFEVGSKRRIAFLRGGQVYDASNNRLGAVREVTEALAGAPDGVGGVALALLLTRGTATED